MFLRMGDVLPRMLAPATIIGSGPRTCKARDGGNRGDRHLGIAARHAVCRAARWFATAGKRGT